MIAVKWDDVLVLYCFCVGSDPFKHLFGSRSASLSGYVTTLTNVEEILQEYGYVTPSRFR